MSFHPLEHKVLSNISQEDVIKLTQELVAMPTENPPADYERISKFIAQEYSILGLEVKFISGQAGKPNVCGRWVGDGTSTETLMLSGHMDVVPAGEGWKHDPFQAVLEGNQLLGRGTADMKGALAAQIIAVRALREAGVKPKGTLYLCATVDDETAGPMGLRYVINEGLDKLGWPKPTFHLLGEPSSLNLFIAFKGRIWVKLTVGGQSAHGGNPAAGVNAIEKMMALIQEILQFERQAHPLMGVDTINIGTIQGGEKTNIVPDQCSVTIDYRFVAPQTSDDLEHRILEAIERMKAKDPQFTLKEFSVFERRDPREVPQNDPYLVSLKGLTEEITMKNAAFAGVLSAGDAYWTLSAGIPAVFYGPGSLSVAHTNKEFVPVDELVAAAKIFALYALRTVC